MNLNSVCDVSSADIEIKLPDGTPTGVFFTMAGPEHPKRKSLDLAQQRKMRAVLQNTGKIDLGDPADDEAEAADKLAAFTLGWRNYTDDAGEEIAFTPTAVGALYADESKAWLRAFLTAAIGERDRFIVRSAKA